MNHPLRGQIRVRDQITRGLFASLKVGAVAHQLLSAQSRISWQVSRKGGAGVGGLFCMGGIDSLGVSILGILPNFSVYRSPVRAV